MSERIDKVDIKTALDRFRSIKRNNHNRVTIDRSISVLSGDYSLCKDCPYLSFIRHLHAVESGTVTAISIGCTKGHSPLDLEKEREVGQMTNCSDFTPKSS